MSSIKDKISNEPIHSRLLSLRTYPADDGEIVVEGSLKDERFQAIYDLSGARSDEGVIHDLLVRLLVGGVPLTILDAEAEMTHVPREQCRETQDSIKRIIGVEIRSGFGERVHKLIGGVKGCAHLTHLLTVLAQEAFHGYWTHKMREPGSPPKSLEDIDGLLYLINSCRLWRQSGPLVREIKAFIENQESTD
jgi:hypothetical protein